jgi:hypothetical protein
MIETPRQKWKRLNPDKHRECQRRYYLKNREAIRAKAIARSQLPENRIKRNASSLQWQRDNRDKVLVQRRKRYAIYRNELLKEQQLRRSKNIEHTRSQSRKYYAKHADKRRAASRIYYHQFKATCQARSKQWKVNNPTKALQQKRDWVAANREKIREHQRVKYSMDMQYCIKRRLSSRLQKLVKQRHATKCDRAVVLLGIRVGDFLKYLESLFKPGMGWHNRSLWHIDHRTPCESFDLTIPEQQRRCFHYTNLQPLWAADNMRKGSKLINEFAG